jgi:hypothetical protein
MNQRNRTYEMTEIPELTWSPTNASLHSSSFAPPQERRWSALPLFARRPSTSTSAWPNASQTSLNQHYSRSHSRSHSYPGAPTTHDLTAHSVRFTLAADAHWMGMETDLYCAPKNECSPTKSYEEGFCDIINPPANSEQYRDERDLVMEGSDLFDADLLPTVSSHSLSAIDLIPTFSERGLVLNEKEIGREEGEENKMDGNHERTGDKRTRADEAGDDEEEEYADEEEDELLQARRCPYPGCMSRASFTRTCDLRKHYRRHLQRFYCRVAGCPRSAPGTASGEPDILSQPARAEGNPRMVMTDTRRLHSWFASHKDRARHEAKHSPHIRCAWEGCGRVFSRLDNMKDHVRRIHGGTRRRRKVPLATKEDFLADGMR